MKKNIEGLCRICGESFTDITSYRKYDCRECHNKRHREYVRGRSETIEGYLRIHLNSIKNHPKRNRFPIDVTLGDLIEIYHLQEGKCALSGIEMHLGMDRKSPYTLSVDRIDSDKGYIKGNVHLIVSALNLFKSNFTTDDLFFIAKSYVDYKQSG